MAADNLFSGRAQNPPAALHPAALFVVLLGTRMQRSAEPILDHLLFRQIAEGGVQFFEIVEVVEDRFDEDIHHFVRVLASVTKVALGPQD